jgi:hypothetical protein
MLAGGVMPKWEKGWKVITKRRFSGFIGDLVHYPKGKVVGRPKKSGPLCVFSIRKSARNFCKDLKHCYDTDAMVVRCLYIESKYSSVWYRNSTPISYYRLPPTTVLAEKVKCLE